MPQKQGWARAADHQHATFPAPEDIPASARKAVDDFLNLRVRISDAQGAVREAHRSLADAKQTEDQELRQHIRNGGTTDTFERTATRAGRQAIEDAQQDYQVLKELIGPAYLAAMYALEAGAAQGIAAADAAVAATAPAYLAAIEATAQARRAYLNAVGLRYFWAYLTQQHQAMAGAGQSDELVLKDGPITRVDDGTFSALRSDAQTHTRINGTSAAANTW
ncbi:hypothetical protein QFZ56_003817 [Streptomyces achromogenes]|uniref:Uncharacterized protein n=1 Tax=Streptomyces achromogenes TaxID=67255 RepID=A0ABU0Q2P3_STRAH|nr:hypothetical protein [Streptomyces achromogenes]MDQ0684854.1 hypothetical protein [Streptomyces achromogenes]